VTRKRSNIPVADWNDDDSTSGIVGADDLCVRRDKQIGRPSDAAIKRIFDNLVTDENRETLRDEMRGFYFSYLEQVANQKQHQAARRRKMHSIARHSAALAKANLSGRLGFGLSPVDDNLA
jgi:hypothetical protein